MATPGTAPTTGLSGHAAGMPARPRTLPPAVRRFLRHRLAAFGAVCLLLLIALAVFAPITGRYSPEESDLRALRQPPGAAHWLGTDLIGRDVWSRVVYGGRVSLTVGLVAVAIYVLIGTALGAAAGWFRGLVDQLIMRLTDTIMSVPSLLMVIVFVSVIGPSLVSVITVIGLLGWPATCRLVRGQFLSLREEEFVTAARVLGAGDLRIVARHILPNALGPLIVLATFGVATAILLEASLSFLGLGVRPPTPSWGGMLLDAQSPTVLSGMPWLWLAPGVAIAVTVLVVNFVGDGLRDALDPRANRT